MGGRRCPMLPELLMGCFKLFVLGIGRGRDTAVSEPEKAPGFEYSDINVTTDDKVVLRAYLVKPREINKDTCFFIVCHGTGCNQYSYSLICNRSGPLAGKNVCVLFADYREFGSSEGQFTMDGASHDIDAYLRYMRETLEAKKVHLWGHALGAAVILKYVCDVKSEKREALYDKVFLVSTFTRFGNAVRGGIRAWVKDERLSTALYNFALCKTLEEHFDYDNMKAVACVDAKDVLIIHSDADEIISKEEAEELSIKSGAKLVITTTRLAIPRCGSTSLSLFPSAKRVCRRTRRCLPSLHVLQMRRFLFWMSKCASVFCFTHLPGLQVPCVRRPKEECRLTLFD